MDEDEEGGGKGGDEQQEYPGVQRQILVHAPTRLATAQRANLHEHSKRNQAMFTEMVNLKHAPALVQQFQVQETTPPEYSLCTTFTYKDVRVALFRTPQSRRQPE